MKPVERGLRFVCHGETLVGVLALPAAAVTGIGVVIAVGGPQYRAGSHRQFTLLARRLAQAGYPVLRFDARGMGDSTGDFPGFDALGPDLDAACAALKSEVAAVRQVVLWGLCDAASAALINAVSMRNLAGLVLLNPWVRHSDTEARTQVKRYYGRRLFDPVFWRKLLAGQVRVGTAINELFAKLWRMARSYVRTASPTADYRDRMVRGALDSGLPQLYILSGRDHVSAEFVEYSRMHPELRGLWQHRGVERMDLPEADHTFSSSALRRRVEDATIAWLGRMDAKGTA
jgi:exosortase A-associated hydrolase 1